MSAPAPIIRITCPTVANPTALSPSCSPSTQGEAADLERFTSEYRLDRECPLGVQRLLRAGIPATVEHGAAGRGGAGGAGGGSSAAHVAEAVQHFITIMDSLKLNMVAADQVYPLLSDLLQSLNQLRLGGPSGAGALAGPARVREWVATVHGMRAAEELSADQVRQLLFDLDSAYTEFMGAVKRGG